MGRSFLATLWLLLCVFVNIQVTAQTKFEVESLNFEGLKKTKASFLTRIAKVKAGKETDSTIVVTDIERLKRLDGIAYADYKVEPVGNSRYKVTYIIKENFSVIPGFRIGQAADDSFSYRLSTFEFNGLGRNIVFGGFFKKEVFNGYGVFIEHPYLFTNKLGLGLNYVDDSSQQPIFFDSYNLENSTNYIFTNKSFETTLFYEHDFKNRFEFSVRTANEQYGLLNSDNEIELQNSEEPRIKRTAFRGVYEHVDIDIVYQNVSGFRYIFDITLFDKSNAFIQTNYIINNTTQYFKRIGSKGNFASQLQLQISNRIVDSAFATLVVDNQINTRGVGNIVDRGSSIVALNSEYRHTLLEKGWFVFQGNGFLDASGVQRPDTNFDSILSNDAIRVQAGIGVRFIHKYIFNAVLRFDYGVNLTGNGGNGFVFGIGQYF